MDVASSGDVSRHAAKTRPTQHSNCSSKLLEAAADRIRHRVADQVCSLDQRGFIATRDIHDGVLVLRCGMELCMHTGGSTAAAILLDMAQASAPLAHLEV